jgi:chloramphenicol 3-O-phosphotransferase
MSQQTESGGNFLDYLVDSFWAALPEETADRLAGFKKDALRGVRSAVDSFVDSEIHCLDRHLENARRMRDQYRQGAASNTAPPNPS